jgi:hypothetical protein
VRLQQLRRVQGLAENEAERAERDESEGADEEGSGAAATDSQQKRATRSLLVGNEATNSPTFAGPAPVGSAIAGATGTITLYPVASAAPNPSSSG